MNIVRWDPFQDVWTLRRSVDRLLDDAFVGRLSRNGAAEWVPAVEMFDTDTEIVVRAELPNIDPNQVDITISNDAITLRGQTKSQEAPRGRNYFRRELRTGTFVRTLPLLTEVNSGDAKATYRDGVLEVKIPKPERVKPTSVKVQVG
ncbi:MAG TPA: Hsp20/alpha crystallin family protein [bacterium]|nr:Hsp20/alpha crystallin family protein [bacterium]